MQGYSCQLKIPMVNQLWVIDENEESIYDFDSIIYMNHKISRVCLSLNICRAIVVS